MPLQLGECFRGSLYPNTSLSDVRVRATTEGVNVLTEHRSGATTFTNGTIPTSLHVGSLTLVKTSGRTWGGVKL